MPNAILSGAQGSRGLARELRRTQTPAEKALWRLLRHRRLRGLKFRRQFPIGVFIADFCCYELRLVIELDGEVHAAPPQVVNDENRDIYLRSRGYLVLRIPNERLFGDPMGVLEEVRSAARQRGWVEPPSPPSPGGRGGDGRGGPGG